MPTPGLSDVWGGLVDAVADPAHRLGLSWDRAQSSKLLRTIEEASLRSEHKAP
jgi:hypothetical protein